MHFPQVTRRVCTNNSQQQRQQELLTYQPLRQIDRKKKNHSSQPLREHQREKSGTYTEKWLRKFYMKTMATVN